MNTRTIGAAAAALALALGCIALGAAPASATDTKQAYVTAVWYAEGTEQWPTEGQTLAASQPQNDKVLALEFVKTAAAKLGCGFTIQGDLYANDRTTAALLAGGKLYGPSNPAESWPGGQYRAEFSTVFYTGDCKPEPVVEQHEASECASSTSYTTRTWTTTDGVVSNEASSTRTLDRAEAISLGCYVPPVLDCPEGTEPATPNEHGDLTECAETPEVPPVDEPPVEVPPVVTPPTVVPPAPSTPVTPVGVEVLASTGGEAEPMLIGGLGLTGLGALLAAIGAGRRLLRDSEEVTL